MAEGKDERATRLAGVVARLGTKPDGADDYGTGYRTFVEQSPNWPEKYPSAWREGQAMTLDQAIAYALQED